MATIILQQPAGLFGLDTSVAPLLQSLQQDTGLVKSYGRVQEDRLKVHPKIGKENTSIFVFIIKNFQL
jgi:hypothetical protein